MQALKQWAHAVADCGRARALDPSYAKALSRLAALLVELRRPGCAANVLDELLALPGLSQSDRDGYEKRVAQARRLSKASLMADHFKLLNVTTEVKVRRRAKT